MPALSAACLLALGGVAQAELTITKPAKGATLNNPTPVFEGLTSDVLNEELETFDPVTVKVYEGTSVEGGLLQEATTPRFSGHEWEVPAKEALSPGTYTVQAVQASEKSEPVTFSVKTSAPAVSITYPANGSSSTGESETVTGTASTASGDHPEVTVNLYPGSAVGPTALLALTVQRSEANGSWSAPFGGLKPGTYTVQAAQKDSSGNTGKSNPVIFTMNAPSPSVSPPPPPPLASFTWFPPTPTVGQSVALVSSSSDLSSPINAFAWDLVGNGPFKAGGAVLTTTFATPGNHVVRLQVIDARGAAGVATETIAVSPAPLALMQPFPIVRIAGNQSFGGVNVSLLTVQAPVGARVSLTCRGRGCSRRSMSRVAVASRHGSSTGLIAFRRPEHRLHPGAILEIRVAAAGEIGKYTRFIIHRRKLPTREDSCVAAFDPRPIACPA